MASPRDEKPKGFTNLHRPERPRKAEKKSKADKGEGDSVFRRLHSSFQEKLRENRGDSRASKTFVIPSGSEGSAKRSKAASKNERMTVPEGVVIEGSLSSVSDAEISGRINGDVAVEHRLHLGPTGKVCGNVRSRHGYIDGVVQGTMECNRELDLGPTGHLEADAIAGADMTLAGQVSGNVTCGGKLRLAATAVIAGNIRARTLIMEEGAVFNGDCSVRGIPSKG